jgi:hypothetical protein
VTAPPHVYVTATLAGDGIGTATLADAGLATAAVGYATVGGFGQDFGSSFAVATPLGPATAVLASNGVGTAAAEEVLVSAALQLV